MLQCDDFYSAEVKKLSGTPYYRAKLDYTNRLLFKVVTYNQKKYGKRSGTYVISSPVTKHIRIIF
jgi:hypothetical protein